jgi:flagellar biosynthesis/type III secretory pathway ATPase
MIYGETLARRGLPPRFFKVLLHVCERGDNTFEIALTHLYTYIMAT